MRITTKWLNDRNACKPQVEVFGHEWPKGVTVSLAALRRASELSLNLDWFARMALSPPLYADYEAKRAPLLWKLLHRQR